MSATVTQAVTLPATASISPLGPLTTIFTPNPACFNIWDVHTTTDPGTSTWNLDSDAAHATCYPAPYRGFASRLLYYSPGVCPESYVYAATTVNAGSTTSAICCPFVAANAPDSMRTQCYHTTISGPGTASTATGLIVGNAITIAWQESDLAGFEPASAPIIGLNRVGANIRITSSTTSSNPTEAYSTARGSATISTSRIDGHQSGLSTGAAVGIGVGATIGFILVLAGFVCLCMSFKVSKRDRRRNGLTSPRSASANSEWSKIHRHKWQAVVGLHEVGAAGEIYESDNQVRSIELDAT